MAPLRRNHSKVLGYTCQGVIDASRRRLGWTDTGIDEQVESARQIGPDISCAEVVVVTALGSEELEHVLARTEVRLCANNRSETGLNW